MRTMYLINSRGEQNGSDYGVTLAYVHERCEVKLD
jgi:hypothetical protein